MEIDRMTMQASIQIDLPIALLRRARVLAPVPARELVTFLLETYAQNLERSQRQQAYESYYAMRAVEDEDEELAILTDFAFADAEAAADGVS